MGSALGAAVFIVAALRRATERRGRRYPARAQTAAVGAARRLHCDARSLVVPHNSLRSLRSLRSNRCGKSDVDARAARAPTSALRFSSPQIRPRRVPPAAPPHRDWSATRQRATAAKARAGWPAQRLCGAEERRPRGRRAQRASTSDLPQLFERSERSERSEFCGRPRGRAPEGSRAAGADRRSRSGAGLPARAFVAPTHPHTHAHARLRRNRNMKYEITSVIDISTIASAAP